MSSGRLAIALSALLALMLGGNSLSAQSAAEFRVRVGGAENGWRPSVEMRGVLRDPALHEALESGLPLRFRLRVELWRKGLFDRLASVDDVHLALLQDPLDQRYRLDTGQNERVFGSLAEVQQALEAAFRSTVRPRGAGRFYYLASLDIETLSLSDLEELRRWLRGEVEPAIEGRSSPGRAVERGLKRILVRVMGLPTRRYEARSGTFVIE